jgi:hypothetical protein
MEIIVSLKLLLLFYQLKIVKVKDKILLNRSEL